jgi:hypothetical protein
MTALLVIACAGFPRRFDDPAYDESRTLYLRQQHHALSTVQRSCDVVFVNNGGETPEYHEYMDFLRGKYRVLDRENTGMSLGAFSAAWKAYPDYDYYILTEDDYIFVLDYFDEEMIHLMGTVPDCGYMCMVVETATHDCPFPGHMTGIAKRALLERLGGFEAESAPSQHPVGDQMQKYFGTQIRETRQFTLADFGSMFKAPFAESRGRACHIVEHYPQAPHTLLLPSQLYTRDL